MNDISANIAANYFKVVRAEYIRWTPERYSHLHTHDDVFHLDVFIGSGLVIFEEETVSISGWTVVFIPPGIKHQFTTESRIPLRNYVIKFTTGFDELRDRPVCCMPAETASLQRRMENGARLILEEFHLPGPGGSEMISCTLASLLIDLFRSRRDQTESNSSRGLVDDACRYMAVNFSEPLTITQVAGHCGVRADSLSRLFRKHMGVAPGTYLSQLRLKQACALLRSGHRVGEAAIQSGFSSIHYFSRAFKKTFGKSPVQWKKR